MRWVAVINAIPAVDCTEAADQRGVARPVGDDCDVGAHEVDAHPDGLLRKGADPFVGMDVFSDDGAGQTVTQKKGKGKTATYTIGVRNDAAFDANAFAVAGTGGNNKFKVKYFDGGGSNITEAVTDTGYLSENLGGDAVSELTLKVKVTDKAKKGNSIETLVTLSASEKPDTVKAVTKRK